MCWYLAEKYKMLSLEGLLKAPAVGNLKKKFFYQDNMLYNSANECLSLLLTLFHH